MDNRHELSSRLLRRNSLILTSSTLDKNGKFKDVSRQLLKQTNEVTQKALLPDKRDTKKAFMLHHLANKPSDLF